MDLQIRLLKHCVAKKITVSLQSWTPLKTTKLQPGLIMWFNAKWIKYNMLCNDRYTGSVHNIELGKTGCRGKHVSVFPTLGRNTAGRKKGSTRFRTYEYTRALYTPRHSKQLWRRIYLFQFTLRHITVSEAQRLQASQFQYAEIHEKKFIGSSHRIQDHRRRDLECKEFLIFKLHLVFTKFVSDFRSVDSWYWSLFATYVRRVPEAIEYVYAQEKDGRQYRSGGKPTHGSTSHVLAPGIWLLWDEVLHRKASSKTIRFTSVHRSTKWPHTFSFQFTLDLWLKVCRGRPT